MKFFNKTMSFDYKFQLKLRGDDFCGAYTNGLSMANGVSVRRCEQVEKNDDKTVFACDDYTVTAYHFKNDISTECYTVFKNTSGRPLVIDMISSFYLEGIEADIMHRARTFWSAEGKLLSQKLTDLNMEKSWANHGARVEKFGQVGSMPVRGYFPFVALENSRKKQFLGVQIYCGSSWQIELSRQGDPLRLSGGLADFDYGHWCKVVNPGESFTTPKAVVATGRSLNEVCDKLVKSQHPRISPVDEDMPVIFNEYCTTWGNPTLENVERIAKKLQGTNVKYLVIDSGWYKKPEQGWFETIGDWNPSEILFPNGIKELTDMIKSYGLIPGIWFEFERAAWESKLYNQVEHLLHRDGVPLCVEGQRFLDMRDPWCHQYLKEKVIDFLRDNGFGYIKVDYNDSIGVGCDGAESLGEGLRQTVLGTQKFFEQIGKELPDLVIEGCSSGGHRLEPSMMELVSQASFSDAHECQSIPLIASNLHRFIRPEQSQIWAVLRKTDSEDRIYYSLVSGFLGRLCLSGDIFDLSNENWTHVLESILFYNKIKDIIKYGATTVIDSTTEDYNKPEGYLAVRREYADKALLTIHTFKGGKKPPVKKYIKGYKIADSFGADLTKDWQAKAFILTK